jgi:hypothetical protein
VSATATDGAQRPAGRRAGAAVHGFGDTDTPWLLGVINRFT